MQAPLATLCLGFSILAGAFLLPTTNAHGQSESKVSKLDDIKHNGPPVRTLFALKLGQELGRAE